MNKTLAYWLIVLESERVGRAYRRKCLKRNVCQERTMKTYSGTVPPDPNQDCWCNRREWTGGLLGWLVELGLDQ